LQLFLKTPNYAAGVGLGYIRSIYNSNLEKPKEPAKEKTTMKSLFGKRTSAPKVTLQDAVQSVRNATDIVNNEKT
jgi:hypothetical protein